jgi:TonB family protein
MLFFFLAAALLQNTAGVDWPSCPAVQGRTVFSALVLRLDQEGALTSTVPLTGDTGFLDRANDAAQGASFPSSLPNSSLAVLCTSSATAHLGYVFDQEALLHMRPPARVTAAVAAGNLVHKVAPRYPAYAKSRSIQGTVAVDAVIGPDGKILALTAVSGPVELRHAAVEAVRQWQYKPFTVQGQPVTVLTEVQVTFVRNS